MAAFLMTECNQSQFEFEAHFSRRVVAEFSGERLTTEGGALLLRATDRKIGLLRRVVSCFTDARDPQRVEHELSEMLVQRVYGLALGYEDLNDHEELRNDPLLGMLTGRRDLHTPLAGKSTLNRLELTPAGSPAAERYNKISYSAEALDTLLVDLFLEAHPRAPREIVLDMDATAGSLEEVQRIVRQIRARWPKTSIILRADSGFCREELLAWCENNDVGYVFGFARNKRLRRIIGRAMQEAQQEHRRTGKPARVFCEFAYRTKKSWSRTRRVIAKAEQIEGKENPRYLVTSLGKEAWSAQKLYEQLYCARGEMENRIKEQLSLFADRMSTETLRTNQLRLYFSSLAYVLLDALRRLGLTGTEWAEAQADTIRLKLLKIAAQVRVSARRIWIHYSSAYPWQNVL